MMENQQNGPPDVRDGAPLPNNTHASQVTASLTVTGVDQLQTSRTDVRDGTVSLGHHRGIIQQSSQVMSVSRESDTVTAQSLVQAGLTDERDGVPLPNHTHASQVTASLTVAGMDQLQTSRTDVRDGAVSLGHHRGIIQQASQVISVSRESDTVTAQSLVQAGDENSTVRTNLNSRSHSDENYNNNNVNDLLAENNQLKETKKCFECRNKDFQYVAMPCGHTFCSDCTDKTECRCGSKIDVMHESKLATSS